MTITSPLTLPRSELYKLVWSKPVTDVAARRRVRHLRRRTRQALPRTQHPAALARLLGARRRRPEIPSPSLAMFHRAPARGTRELRQHAHRWRKNYDGTCRDVRLRAHCGKARGRRARSPYRHRPTDRRPRQRNRHRQVQRASPRAHLQPWRQDRPDPPPRCLPRNARPRAVASLNRRRCIVCSSAFKSADSRLMTRRASTRRDEAAPASPVAGATLVTCHVGAFFSAPCRRTPEMHLVSWVFSGTVLFNQQCAFGPGAD